MSLATLRSLASRPSIVALSLLGGVGLGLAWPGFAKELALVSNIYLALLKMVVLPFMVSAIIFSIYRLFQAGHAGPLLARIGGSFLLALLLAATLGLLAAQLIAPGRELPPETMQQLGRMVDQGSGLASVDEMPLQAPAAPAPGRSFGSLVLQLIPDNIFAALAQGETLKAFVFALLFGCALAQAPRQIAESLSNTMETVFHACQTLTRWFNYFLPLVLLTMIASQIARSGLEPLQAMIGFIAALAVASGVLILLSFWVLVRSSGHGWRSVLASQREPLTMALATRSSQACMPAMIESLVERLGFPHYRIELLVPLGISLLRVGPALYYGLATMFIAQLYDRVLSINEMLIVVLASVLAGLASTGMSGLLVLSLVGLVCAFLNLPVEAALVLFAAIEPACDTLRTLVGVAVNNAVAAAICGRPEKTPEIAQAAASVAMRN